MNISQIQEPADLFDLNGRIAIVTGGLGLLGGQFAKTLAYKNAVVVIFDTKEKNSSPTVNQLQLENLPIHVFQIDISVKSEVSRAMDIIASQVGTPSILINNAGINVPYDGSPNDSGPFEDYEEKAWDAVLNSHLKGSFLSSQIFIKKLKTTGKTGSIINISSTYGLVSPDQSVYEYRRQRGENYYKPVSYSVAKAGMIGFTKWLAEYCAPFGIRVNTLVPGGVFSEGLDPEFVQEYQKRTMLGRMAQANDYNGAVLFLASNASSYMTGATLVVDGGWTAR